MAVVDINFNKACREVLETGKEYVDKRRDVNRIQVPSITFKHSFSDGFPAITNKKLAFKFIKGELIWFLRGDTNIKYLLDNDIPIWTKDAYNLYVKVAIDNEANLKINNLYAPCSNSLGIRNCKPHMAESYSMFTMSEFQNIIESYSREELTELYSFEGYTLGDVGRNYSAQWRSFNGHVDQIEYIIKGMRENIMSTWLKVAAWNPAELHLTALPPCHDGFQVIGTPLTREDMVSLALKRGINVSRKIIKEELVKLGIPEYGFELHWNQRSTDLFLGAPFNIASYALMAEILAEITVLPTSGIEGALKCVHFYDNQYKAVDTMLTRDTGKHGNCTLEIADAFRNLCRQYREGIITLDELFNHTQIGMFRLVGYTSDDAISVEMLAPKSL